MVQFIADDGWCAQGALNVITHPVSIQAEPYGPFCSNDGQQAYPVVTPVPVSNQDIAWWSSLSPEPDWSSDAPYPNENDLTGMPDPHIITYHFTNSYGCTNSLDIPFTIHDTTLVNWDANQLNICQGAAPVPLLPMVDQLGGTFEVYYGPGNGWVQTTVFDPDSCPPSTCDEAYSVRYTFQNLNGCQSINESEMTVHPLPTPDFTWSPDTLCLGDSVHVDETSSIDCGSLTDWAWQKDGNPYSNDQNLAPILFADCGMHTISLEVTSQWGCAATVEQAVEIHCLPVLTANPYGPFCSNDGQQAYPSVTPIPVPGQDSAWWSSLAPEPDWSSDAPNPDANDLTGMPDPHIITYHFTNSYGCTESLDIPFTVHDTTLVNWDPNQLNICQGAAPVPLLPMVDHHPGTFEVYYGPINVWVQTTVFDPDSCQLAACEVQYPVRYIYQNSYGCESTNESVMTVHPLPHPSFTVNDSICAYDSLVIVNTSTIGCGNIANWNWTIPGHGSPITENVGPFLYAAGTRTIRLIVTSEYGCADTVSHDVIIHPVPVAAFSAPDSCQYDAVPYTDQSTIAAPDLITAWHWDFGDNTPNVATPNSAHAWQGYGDFTVTLLVTSNFECVDATTHEITIHPAPVDSMAFDPNCFEETSTMQSFSTIPQGTIESTIWTMDSIELSGTPVDHIFSAPGFYPIQLRTVSDQGCSTTITDTIEIWPLPTVDYNLSQQVLCANGVVVFSDASSIPPPYHNTAWSWFINDSLWGTGETFEQTFRDSGTFDVALVVTSGDVCRDTLANAAQILVHPLPVAGFAADPLHTDIQSPEVQVTDSSMGATHWAYHFGDGPPTSYDREPFHRYSTYGNYLVQQVVTNEFDCTDTAYAQVIIDPEVIIYVPNTFTPDGDGVNDVFKPSLDGFGIKEYALTILDRWGERIFETTDADQAWDGQLNVRPVQDGVYVWKLEITAVEFTAPRHLIGHVTVLR